MKVIQITVNNYYMDNQGKRPEQRDDSALFAGICLIALGLSLIGNVLVEYFSK